MLKCIPKISTPNTFVVTCRHVVTCRWVKILSNPTHTFPAKDKQGDTLPSCFSCHIICKCPFCNLSMPHFFAFLCAFCWWCHCLKWPLSILQSRVPKCKKAVICLTEKTCVLEKLCSGMSYSTIGHEFNVNEPNNIYFKRCLTKTHIKWGYVLIGW